jgi:hypothetical protein
MKTNIQLLALIFFSITFTSFTSNAQKKAKPREVKNGGRFYYHLPTKMLYLDPYLTQKVNRPLVVKEDKEVSIEVVGYNLLLDEVSFKDTVLFHDIPNLSAFQNLSGIPSLPTSGQSNLNAKSILGTLSIDNFMLDTTSIPTYNEKFAAQTKEIQQNLQNQNEIYHKVIQLHNHLGNLMQLKAKVLSNNKLSLQDFNELSTKYFNQLSEYTGERYEGIFDETILKSITELDSLFIQKQRSLNQTNLILLEELAKVSKTDIEKEELKKLRHLNTNFESDFKQLNVGKFPIALKAFSADLIDLKKMFQKIVLQPVFVSPSIIAKADIQQIQVFHNRDKNLGPSDAITIRTNFGIKCDVSGGLFLSGLYDETFVLKSSQGFYQTQYLLNGSPKDTLINQTFTTISKEKNGKFSYGGMCYLNFHTGSPHNFNYGAYAGIGALLNDQTRWTGALGGELIFGKSQKLIVHAGVNIAQIKRLESNYQVDVKIPEVISNVPIVKLLDYSWMFGLSWKINKP